MRLREQPLKKLPDDLKHIKIKNNKFERFNLYYADESRFGLLTRIKRVLCLRGVKPIAPFQHKFDYTYLFGAFSPINGNSLILEMPFCNTSTTQAFINELSEMDSQEFKIVIWDNASFHHSKSLRIPDNICLIFLPPYSPELNPAEKFWWMIKNKTSLKIYTSLDELSSHLSEIIKTFTHHEIKHLTDFDYIHKAYQTIINV